VHFVLCSENETEADLGLGFGCVGEKIERFDLFVRKLEDTPATKRLFRQLQQVDDWVSPASASRQLQQVRNALTGTPLRGVWAASGRCTGWTRARTQQIHRLDRSHTTDSPDGPKQQPRLSAPRRSAPNFASRKASTTNVLSARRTPSHVAAAAKGRKACHRHTDHSSKFFPLE